MSEIPLEISMNAERLYDEGGYESVPTIIAKAIMAERARCAEVARSGPYHGSFQTKGDERRAEEIAARILAGTEGNAA